MARQKNGTPTGFKDSKGVEIKVGDTIKGPTGIGYVRGSKVKFKDGRAPELQALMKNGNQYTVVHLSKVEKPEKGQEPDFIPGQVVASDDGIMFFKGTTKSGASADVVCFWNKKSGTVQVSWVVPLKALRWASDEESKEFQAKLKEVGLSLDKRSMQALKVEPLFKKGDWVKSGTLFGRVESWNSKEITLTWACEGKNISYNTVVSDAHICNPNEQLECMRLLTLAGYTFTSDWRLIELQFVLPNEIKDKVGSKEITISEVASLIRASKKEDLHGELSLKLTFYCTRVLIAR